MPPIQPSENPRATALAIAYELTEPLRNSQSADPQTPEMMLEQAQLIRKISETLH